MFANLAQQFPASAVGRWYYGREPSERSIIRVLAVIVAVAIVWLGVWKPVSDWREIADNRYRNAQSTLDWMQANESTARAVAQNRQAAGSRRALLPTITGAAQAHGLTLNRVQPESNGAVSVMVQSQAFNAVLIWLNHLQVENQVVVQRIALDAEDRPGYVNAQVRLQ